MGKVQSLPAVSSHWVEESLKQALGPEAVHVDGVDLDGDGVIAKHEQCDTTSTDPAVWQQFIETNGGLEQFAARFGGVFAFANASAIGRNNPIFDVVALERSMDGASPRDVHNFFEKFHRAVQQLQNTAELRELFRVPFPAHQRFDEIMRAVETIFELRSRPLRSRKKPHTLMAMAKRGRWTIENKAVVMHALARAAGWDDISMIAGGGYVPEMHIDDGDDQYCVCLESGNENGVSEGQVVATDDKLAVVALAQHTQRVVSKTNLRRKSQRRWIRHFLDVGLARDPHNFHLHLQQASVLLSHQQYDEALAAVAVAEEAGALPQDVNRVRMVVYMQRAQRKNDRAALAQAEYFQSLIPEDERLKVNVRAMRELQRHFARGIRPKRLPVDY